MNDGDVLISNEKKKKILISWNIIKIFEINAD